MTVWDPTNPGVVVNPITHGWVFNGFYKSYRVTNYAKHKAIEESSRQVYILSVYFENLWSRLFSQLLSMRVLYSPFCFVLYVIIYFGECRIHLVVYSTKCVFGFYQITLLYRISIIILITSIMYPVYKCQRISQIACIRWLMIVIIFWYWQ